MGVEGGGVIRVLLTGDPDPGPSSPGAWRSPGTDTPGRHMWGVGYIVLNYDLTTAD